MQPGAKASRPALPFRRRRFQAVIFDAVGTLLHPREPVGETYARLARRYGVDLPASRLEEAFSRMLAAAKPNVFPGRPLAEVAELDREWWRALVRGVFRAADGAAHFEDFDAFFDTLFETYASHEAWELTKGTRETLTELHREGRVLAVLSNFDQRLRGILRGKHIHHYFAAVTLPADAGAAKPDRAIFDICLKRLGLPGHRCLYVGDRAREDLEAARAAEMLAIDVASLSSLTELPERIHKLEQTE